MAAVQRSGAGMAGVQIDDADRALVEPFAWHRSCGYVVTSVPKAGGGWTLLALHRLLLGAKPGDIVDHINGVTTDNRRANLRLVTATENARNARAKSLHDKGVSEYRKADGSAMYRVLITINRRTCYLGAYRDPVDAAGVYDAAALRAFGRFARINGVPNFDLLDAALGSVGRRCGPLPPELFEGRR